METSLLTNLFLSVWNDSWVLSNVRRMRMGGNARLTWSRQRKSWLSEPVSFFKIGVDLNGMSASEYLPLYQSFTNRTHIRNGRRFDQSEISQIVEKNIWCNVILSGLIQLKSTPQTEYIVLPYNTRASTLWTPSGDTIPAGKRVVKCDTQLWTPLNFEQTVRPNPNLACDRRQISITPRRLYVIILRIFVIQPSTPFNLNDIESGSRRSAFRSQHEGYYPALSGTLPLPQVTMAKNVHRVQKCAMTRCPQIYNPLILKVAKRDLWTYRSQLSNM